MAQDKLSLYEKRLLDLGKRNRLLNFRYFRLGALEVIAPSAVSLYNKLQSPAASIKVIDVVANEEGAIPTREQLLSKYAGKLTSNQVILYRSDLNSRPIVRSLMKKADSYLSEKGTNILYFAFGFISYKDPDTKELLKAPLLLVPVVLEGGGPAQPFLLRPTSDEAELNPTLAYYCKTVYKLDLPAFDLAKDYEAYLKEIADKVAPLGWSVDPLSAALSTFSFQKMSMYLDLKENRDAILSNPIIDRLLGGDKPLNEEPLKKDEAINGIAFHNVCLADSSQLYAIKTAKEGHSFVLQGPPGTGKSQTITNIIAESLYEGKKVLFVSEKKAALEVVFNNLRKAGLDSYCLELHSDKTDKKRVFTDLEKTLEMKTLAPSKEAEEDIASLVEKRTSLDKYCAAIHKPTDFGGLSFYEIAERLVSLSSTDASGYLVPKIESKDKAFLDDALAHLSKYDSYAKQFGYDYRKSPLSDFDPRPYNYALQDAIAKKVPVALEALEAMGENQKALLSLLGRNPDFLMGHAAYEAFVKEVAASSFEGVPLFAKATRDATRKNLERLAAEQAKLLKEGAELQGKVALAEDREAIRLLVEREGKGYGLFFLFSQEWKANGQRIDRSVSYKCRREEKVALLKRQLAYDEKLASFKKELSESLRPFDESYDEGLKTDFRKMLSLLDHYESASKEGYFLNAFKPSLAKGDLRSSLKKAIVSYAAKTKKLEAVFKALQPSFIGSKKDLSSVSYGELLSAFKALEPYLASTREVALCRDWVDGARRRGILDFVNKALSASLPSESLAKIYEKDFLTEEIHHQISLSPVLAKFNRSEHERLIESFAKLDEEQYKISTLQISANVGKRRPDPNQQSGSSPVGVILREAAKSTRVMPTRYLLQHYFETVSNIKPVFLMSPLSVATYLRPEAQFDIVVFDEASQIYPEDALGAIYRGKQAVIVGDSRQLPPTSFFQVTEDEPEVSDEDYVEDDSSLESILDLAAAYLPPERLLWHYRSKNEELIAYSNKEFYNSSLYSFPSASKRVEDGIHLHYLPNGIYEAGKRVNEAEADYIVNLIYKLGRDYPTRSLGVVAFSESQADLIDKKLELRRLKDKSLEATHFAPSLAEPLFVKNLETVQGDERDIMILSVCYGKDKEGKFYQRFGPLNNEGGERRLNVAITRAKYALELVSSILSSDIDTSKTASLGVKELKGYLSFADNPGADKFAKGADDDAIARNIASFLKEQGYAVDEGYGFSHGSVELAVRSAKDGESHEWAIETDGALYKDAKNARDREELRPYVLKNMGWKYLRVYSQCYAENPKEEQALILRALRSGNDNDGSGEKEEKAAPKDGPDEALAQTIADPKQGLGATPFKPYLKSAPLKEPYVHCRGGRYFMTVTSEMLRGAIYALISMEGPLDGATIYRRLASIADNKKAPSQAADHMAALIKTYGFQDVLVDDGFYYLSNKENPFAFRTVDPGSKMPLPLEDISLKELQDGLEKELWRSGPTDRDALYKRMVTLLGYERVTENAKQRLSLAISSDPKIHAPSEVVSLVE